MATTSMISFLGTGSGIPSADRFFSSTLLYLEGVHLLLDAGEPCVHLLRERGTLLQEIDAVLITHGHVDHIGGLPALLQGCKLLDRTKPLPIYLPKEMIAPVRAWISALYLVESELEFVVLWNAWENDAGVLLNGGITVTPHRNSHLDQCYGCRLGAEATRSCDSFSLEVKTATSRLIFSGDLGAAEELAPLLLQPTKLLVSELAHFSMDQLTTTLKGVPIETLCLVHLSDAYSGSRSELQIQMEEQLPTIQNVIIPEDGEVLDF